MMWLLHSIDRIHIKMQSLDTNIRLRVAMLEESQGKSLNSWAQEALLRAVIG